MKNRIKFIVCISGCTLMFVAGFFLQQTFSHAEKSSPATNNDVIEDRHKDEADHNDEPNKAAELSDLDRPIEAMWSQKCEHNINQYSCDECRYELGVVKIAPTVFGTESAAGLIAAATVTTRPISRSLSLTGEVKVNENITVNITSAVTGIITKAAVSTGQVVAQGDVLLQIDSPDAAEAKGNYLKQLAALSLAKKVAAREESLFAKMVSAQADVETAKAQLAQATVDRANARTKLIHLGLSKSDIANLERGAIENITGLLTIRAPHAGVVIEKTASTGERVEPGKPLFLLSDLSKVFVWADLKEDDLHRLNATKHKVRVEVEAKANPGKVYHGKIDVIAGIMNEETRTAQARIILDNPESRLKPGMFVNIRLILPDGGKVMAVPKIAVVSDAGRSFVFVHKEGDYWIRRPVSLGETLQEYMEIKEGLTIGQKIIATGSFLLKSDVLRKKMGAGCAD